MTWTPHSLLQYFLVMFLHCSFTIEASFCGPSIGPHANTQFRPCDLERMGRDFCLGLFVHFDIPALQAVKLKEKEELKMI